MSALEFLPASVEKKNAQKWMKDYGENLLRELKKKREVGEPSLDWTR